MHIASCISLIFSFMIVFACYSWPIRSNSDLRPSSWDPALWETAPVLFLVFCGEWSLSVATAVVCCCWLLKFVTCIRSSSGPGSLSEYFMILRIPEFDLWILSAVETTELLILWGMTLLTNSATKLLQIRSVMELSLLRRKRPGKQRERHSQVYSA